MPRPVMRSAPEASQSLAAASAYAPPAVAPASSASVCASPSETTCYYDDSVPDLDAEAQFAGCTARCRVDVHLPPGDSVSSVGGEARPVLLFVHGGTWRVGDRRSMMFSGQHYALAQSHEVVVLSVGYRRSRMPGWVFWGLYPVRAIWCLLIYTHLRTCVVPDTSCAVVWEQLVIVLLASLATAPFVVAAIYLFDFPLHMAPVPAICIFIVYVLPTILRRCWITVNLSVFLRVVSDNYYAASQLLLLLGDIPVWRRCDWDAWG